MIPSDARVELGESKPWWNRDMTCTIGGFPLARRISASQVSPTPTPIKRVPGPRVESVGNRLSAKLTSPATGDPTNIASFVPKARFNDAVSWPMATRDEPTISTLGRVALTCETSPIRSCARTPDAQLLRGRPFPTKSCVGSTQKLSPATALNSTPTTVLRTARNRRGERAVGLWVMLKTANRRIGMCATSRRSKSPAQRQ